MLTKEQYEALKAKDFYLTKEEIESTREYENANNIEADKSIITANANKYSNDANKSSNDDDNNSDIDEILKQNTEKLSETINKKINSSKHQKNKLNNKDEKQHLQDEKGTNVKGFLMALLALLASLFYYKHFYIKNSLNPNISPSNDSEGIKTEQRTENIEQNKEQKTEASKNAFTETL